MLDVGCGTGKNAALLISAGHDVTLLDIAPKALQDAQQNLQHLGLSEGVIDSINGSIEALDPRYGPFKAVVGTYVFSFIPPNVFQEVMQNVLGRVKPGGYFVGSFFGAEDTWATDPDLTKVTLEELDELFASVGLMILCVEERKEETPIAFDRRQIFHTIEVTAERTGCNL